MWYEKKTSYLESLLHVHGSKSPSLLVPYSKPTAPLQPPSHQFPCAHSNQHNIYLYTDGINKPASSSSGTVFLEGYPARSSFPFFSAPSFKKHKTNRCYLIGVPHSKSGIVPRLSLSGAGQLGFWEIGEGGTTG